MHTSRILPPDFYDRRTPYVARDLLGKVIVRRMGERHVRGIITEVEAYDGERDRACHAHKGRTPRTEIMYGPSGYWYVYFIYGMHWMMNVVTGPVGFPAAVLIRGVLGVDGPGLVAKRFRVSQALYGSPATVGDKLWIEDGGYDVRHEDVVRTPRIGVDYAGSWAKLPYRFVWTLGGKV